MNVNEIINTVKEKAGLNDDIAAKVGDALKSQDFASNIDKDKIISILKEKVGLSDEIASKVYDAIAGALTSGVMDKVKGLFGKN